MSKARVTSIEIEIGDSVQKLTVAQAKELYAALGELVGDKPAQLIPYDRPYPVYPRPYPKYWETVWMSSTGLNTTGSLLASGNANCNTARISMKS